MLKDSTVSAHVETDIKQEAEDILQKLGIPVSVVINSLYRQIIFTKGIKRNPFFLNYSNRTQNPRFYVTR